MNSAQSISHNAPMATVLFFDTETTGLVDRYAAEDDPRQPDVVQIAAILIDPAKPDSPLASFCSLVRPAKDIDPGAAKAHGITKQMADAYGLSPLVAFSAFRELVARADTLVAHNLSFDALVMRTAWHRTFGTDLRDELQGKKAFCTMKAMTPVCKILTGRSRHSKDWKWPKLSECIEFFFGEKLEGAHDALVDTKACARVYFELMRRRENVDAAETGL